MAVFESNKSGFGTVSESNNVAAPHVELSHEQEAAVELCCDLSEPIVGITGSAGTGKTLVLGHVYRRLAEELGASKIVLAAPTGRAAKRIMELTGIDARTVHRMLEFPMPDDPPDGKGKPIPGMPRRNSENPLEQTVIIIDEASMLSTELYEFVQRAMSRKAVIRMFGDNEQLAPVEDNSGLPPPFIDVLKSHPSIVLTYNFRSQDEIVSNAQLILKGQLPKRNRRFEIIYTDHPVEQLLDFVTPEFADSNHQIIMPMRKASAGTMRVNPSLQLRFNPRGPMLRLQRFGYKDAPLSVRAKDKFLWVKNDYQLAVFNGEIGHIDWLDQESGELGLLAGPRAFTVPPRIKYFNYVQQKDMTYDPRTQIELGYAITTHKSQGSEFDTVVYCISRANYYLLSRRNLYTAITRAKTRVILITDRFAMSMSLRKKD
jgi:exodeoxyribonuclease V alpha subunit